MVHLITTEDEKATSRTATETHNYDYNLSNCQYENKTEKVCKFMEICFTSSGAAIRKWNGVKWEQLEEIT